jgi:hypothetical protein
MDSVARAAEILSHAEKSLRELASKAVESGEYTNVLKITSWAKGVQELLGVRAAPPAPARGSKKKTAAAKPKVEYPQFFRRGDILVRIAWSKHKRKEYQHKAPHTVVLAVADAVATVARDGGIFSTEKFLPVSDSEGNEVPNYQAYLAVSLLKQVGLIDQHGRQGYSVPRLAEFKDALKGIWEKLPTKRI